MKTKLSVNINKVALIRNSRITEIPNLVEFAVRCEEYGADGITVHPRPDERHIRYSDLPQLKEVINTELNIEGYPSENLLRIVENIKPHQFTAVPDPPGALTSEKGWNINENSGLLTELIIRLKESGIRSSFFIDPEESEVEACARLGADRIELYTGHYANCYNTNREKAVEAHRKCAVLAHQSGIMVNAGHDLNLSNLAYYAQGVPYLAEVSIGHSLISDALYFGIENAIGLYKEKLR